MPIFKGYFVHIENFNIKNDKNNGNSCIELRQLVD